MRAKLGLAEAQTGDRELIEGILKLLAADRVDYPIFWRRLSHCVAGEEPAETVRDLFLQREAFDAWLLQYSSGWLPDDRAAARVMLKANPKYVLRNHLGELAIRQAKLKDCLRGRRAAGPGASPL